MLHDANAYYMLIDTSLKCELDQAVCALLFHETSLNCLTSLNKIAQIRREKQANYSDMVSKSGKSFRLGEKIRLSSSASREKGVLSARLSRILRPTKKRTWRKSRSVALTSSKNALSHRAPSHRRTRAQRMLQVSSKPYRRNQTRG